jgi:hypothetical protein
MRGARGGVFRQDDPPTERQLWRDETGYTGGLWKWLCYEDGLRLLGGSASSPDPFFKRGRRGIPFRHNSKGIHHGAFEEGLDKINRIGA